MFCFRDYPGSNLCSLCFIGFVLSFLSDRLFFFFLTTVFCVFFHVLLSFFVYTLDPLSFLFRRFTSCFISLLIFLIISFVEFFLKLCYSKKMFHYLWKSTLYFLTICCYFINTPFLFFSDFVSIANVQIGPIIFHVCFL